MSKNSKIILSIISFIILISIVLFLLIFFEVIYNPFINNRDLKCSRTSVGNKEVFSFKFNWIGKVDEAKKIDYVYFETLEEASEYYNYYIEEENFTNVKIEEKTVIFNYDILKGQIDIGTSRKTLLNDFRDFGFDCK